MDRACSVLWSIIEPFWSSRCQLLWDDFRGSGCPLPLLKAPSFTISSDWALDHFLGFLNTTSASKLCKQALGESILDDACQRITRAWGPRNQVRRVDLPLHLMVARKDDAGGFAG